MPKQKAPALLQELRDTEYVSRYISLESESPVAALNHKNKKKSRAIINQRPINNAERTLNGDGIDKRGCQAH